MTHRPWTLDRGVFGDLQDLSKQLEKAQEELNQARKSAEQKDAELADALVVTKVNNYKPLPLSY